jgi:acetylornithine deacetylase/succinyl-diaminopimelate desuccinylase-like protein
MVKDVKLYGRGACDVKLGIASMVKAIEAIGRAGLRLNRGIIIESVVGEELMSHELGTSCLHRRGYRTDAAIDTELLFSGRCP